MYVMYTTNNYYYTLFYFFVVFFNYGFFLSWYQLEFFVGFLWLTECLVVFVFLLLLFYINNPGNFLKLRSDLNRFFILGALVGFYSLLSNLIIYSETEWYIPWELKYEWMWGDYYEALNNLLLNDGLGLMISFYLINSFEFLLLTLLLLFGSLVVVNMNKLNKDIQHPVYNTFLEIFSFLKNWLEGFFIRKQNLTNQEQTYASTRNFIKK